MLTFGFVIRRPPFISPPPHCSGQVRPDTVLFSFQPLGVKLFSIKTLGSSPFPHEHVVLPRTDASRENCIFLWAAVLQVNIFTIHSLAVSALDRPSRGLLWTLFMYSRYLPCPHLSCCLTPDQHEDGSDKVLFSVILWLPLSFLFVGWPAVTCRSSTPFLSLPFHLFYHSLPLFCPVLGLLIIFVFLHALLYCVSHFFFFFFFISIICSLSSLSRVIQLLVKVFFFLLSSSALRLLHLILCLPLIDGDEGL